MSSLLERIARRRRASAGRRLGPPPGSAGASPPLNGHGVNGTRNGQSPSRPAPEWAAAPEAPVLPSYESWLPAPGLLSPTAPAMPAAVAEPAVIEPAVDAPDPGAPETPGATLEMPLATPETPVAGAPVGAPEAEPGRTGTEAVPAARPGFLERGRMRRRARYLRRLRELQLRDLGGFLLEAHRYGRERTEIVHGKVRSTAQVDRELRALEHALDGRVPLRELRLPGIGGACPRCGTVHGSGDRFCSRCGRSLTPDDSAR